MTHVRFSRIFAGLLCFGGLALTCAAGANAAQPGQAWSAPQETVTVTPGSIDSVVSIGNPGLSAGDFFTSAPVSTVSLVASAGTVSAGGSVTGGSFFSSGGATRALTPAAVGPEPGSLALLLGSLPVAGGLFVRRRRRAL